MVVWVVPWQLECQTGAQRCLGGLLRWPIWGAAPEGAQLKRKPEWGDMARRDGDKRRSFVWDMVRRGRLTDLERR